MFSTLPLRCKGICLARRSRYPSVWEPGLPAARLPARQGQAGGRISPGATALTRTRGANSTAAIFVNSASVFLDNKYAAYDVLSRTICVSKILIMLPSFAQRAKERIRTYGALRLTAKCRSQDSKLPDSREDFSKIEALLTRTSRRPNSSSTAGTRSPVAWPSARSQANVAQTPPSLWIRLAVCSAAAPEVP